VHAVPAVGELDHHRRARSLRIVIPLGHPMRSAITIVGIDGNSPNSSRIQQ
jgi:hypothetical protein